MAETEESENQSESDGRWGVSVGQGKARVYL